VRTARERVLKRMRRNRPTVTLSLKLPTDLLEDLEEMAQERRIPDAETLARIYIGWGLRQHLRETRIAHKLTAVREAGPRPPVAKGAEVSEEDVLAAAIRVHYWDSEVFMWLTDAPTRRSPWERMYSPEARREIYDALVRMHQ
jgi:hypothetical protein